MNLDLLQLTELLKGIAGRIGHAREHGEATIVTANAQIKYLGESGLVPAMILLGPVVLTRPYPIQSGRTESCLAIQAALDVPRGIGAVIWDTEDYLTLEHDPDQLHYDARIFFHSFDECESAVQALLVPHAKELLARFVEDYLL